MKACEIRHFPNLRIWSQVRKKGKRKQNDVVLATQSASLTLSPTSSLIIPTV